MKKKRSKILNIILVVLIISFVIGFGIFIYSNYSKYKDKKTNQNIVDNIVIEDYTKEDKEDKTERMLKLEKLQETNSDIIGLLKIDGTNIDYPVLQTTDNDFYLKHNYKKEYSEIGSIFLDKDFDLKKPSTNYLIYGHRTTTGLMFEDLIKYADESFYKEHTKIQLTTNNEDCMYEIIAVFYSRVYYKNETGVFRYYYFVDADNEAEYNDFVNNSKRASIYDTGVSASYGEQLLTLSTCEYSREDGRFAIVAKKCETLNK